MSTMEPYIILHGNYMENETEQEEKILISKNTITQKVYIAKPH